MKTFWATLFFLLLHATSWAQSICTTPPQTTTQITSTTRSAVAMTMTNFNDMFNGQQVVTDVDLQAFAKGADPNTAKPVAAAMFARSAVTVLDAATFCYRIVVPFLALVAPNTEYDLRTRLRGNVFNDAGVASLQFGPWSPTAIPFGRSAPTVAPTGMWITP